MTTYVSYDDLKVDNEAIDQVFEMAALRLTGNKENFKSIVTELGTIESAPDTSGSPLLTAHLSWGSVTSNPITVWGVSDLSESEIAALDKAGAKVSKQQPQGYVLCQTFTP